MYLAEIHGKLSRDNENKEDILTSNVFSFFKYANRELFLRKFGQSLELDITQEDAQNAEFHFWPSFSDRTEPDLVILIGKYYLLIEAKYHSGFGKETPTIKNQLAREVEGGLLEAQNLDLAFRLIVVTADYYFKREILDAVPDDNRKDVIWVNWQAIAYLLDDLLKYSPALPSESKLIAEDLYQLLLKKNLRNYEGVQVLSKVQALKSHPETLFFQAATAAYRGDFIGFGQALGTFERLRPTPGSLFFGKTMKLFQTLPETSLQLKGHNQIFFRGSKADGRN